MSVRLNQYRSITARGSIVETSSDRRAGRRGDRQAAVSRRRLPHGKAFRKGEPVLDDIRGVEDDEFDREVFTQCMYVPIGEYGTIR
jgi:hypothetical protein